MQNRVILLLAGMWWVGCSTAKLNTEKPIEIEKSFWGTSYKQEGETLDREDLVRQLRIHSASQDEMSGYQLLMLSGGILSGVGGFLIGWPIGAAIGGDPQPPWVMAYAGAGVAVVGGVCGYFAEEKLHSSALLYNRSFSSKKTGLWDGIRVSPVFSLRGLGRERGVTAGVRLGF